MVQVVERDVAHHLVHALRAAAHLGGHLLALALARLRLGPEGDRLREEAVLVDGHRAADDVRPLLVEHLHPTVVHHRVEPPRISHAALDDLHEARIVRAALEHQHHVVAVVEGGLAVEAGGRLGPPLPLLGPVGVALGRLAGVETHHPDELVVVGDAVGAAEEAHRPLFELVMPLVHQLVDAVGIVARALDDLDEHHSTLRRVVGRFLLKWSIRRRYARM